LDRHAVTEEERKAAKKLLKKLAKLDNFSLTTKVVVVPKYTQEEEQQRAEALAACLEKLRQATFTSRVALEMYFAPFDKRHLGKINRDLFWAVLEELSLVHLLSEVLTHTHTHTHTHTNTNTHTYTLVE